MGSNSCKLVQFLILSATRQISVPLLQHPALPPAELLLRTGPQLELDWQGHLRHLRYLSLEHTAHRTDRTSSFIGLLLLQ